MFQLIILFKNMLNYETKNLQIKTCSSLIYNKYLKHLNIFKLVYNIISSKLMSVSSIVITLVKLILSLVLEK